MNMKSQLQKLVKRSYQEIQRFAETLSPEDQAACGARDNWTARDVIAHLVEEKRRVVERLDAARLDLPVEEPENFELENAKTWEAYKGYSFAELMEALDEVQAELLDKLDAFGESELYESRRHGWLHGRPLWRYIAGIDFLHAMAHIGPLYIQRGAGDYAERLRRQEARLAGALDPSPGWQGLVTYNLACHHALMGEKDVAIDELRSALSLAPALIAWAQQDNDLRSLHPEPQFKQMIAELAPKG